MTPEQDVQRGIAARQLLADPLLAEAFTELEQEWTEKWLKTSNEDVAGRERMFRQIQSLRETRNLLEVRVQRGQLAEVTLTERVRVATLRTGQRLASALKR